MKLVGVAETFGDPAFIGLESAFYRKPVILRYQKASRGFFPAYGLLSLCFVGIDIGTYIPINEAYLLSIPHWDLFTEFSRAGWRLLNLWDIEQR